ELLVLRAERLQAAVRAARRDRLGRRRGLAAPDRRHEAPEGQAVVEGLEELDPGPGQEELQQRHVAPPGAVAAGQPHREGVEALGGTRGHGGTSTAEKAGRTRRPESAVIIARGRRRSKGIPARRRRLPPEGGRGARGSRAGPGGAKTDDELEAARGWVAV